MFLTKKAQLKLRRKFKQTHLTKERYPSKGPFRPDTDTKDNLRTTEVLAELFCLYVYMYVGSADENI